MTEPLADRLLAVLGDSAARAVVRGLLHRAQSQTDLVTVLGLAQATVSRAVKILRAVGLIRPQEGGRSPRLTVTAPEETAGVLLAADRLAEELLDREHHAQRERSTATRRAVVKPAEQNGATNGGKRPN
jgi:DNA-binding transcriptional ArsR family regulator